MKKVLIGIAATAAAAILVVLVVLPLVNSNQPGRASSEEEPVPVVEIEEEQSGEDDSSPNELPEPDMTEPPTTYSEQTENLSERDNRRNVETQEYDFAVAPEYEDTAMRNKFIVPEGVDPTKLTYEDIYG